MRTVKTMIRWFGLQADLSLCCLQMHEETFLSVMKHEETDLTTRLCRLVWVFIINYEINI